MNLHTNYPVLPGVYKGSVLDQYVVVKTIITQNVMGGEKKPLENPLVVFEPLRQDINKHEAYTMMIDEFMKSHSPA